MNELEVYIQEKFNEIRVIVESIELDALKCSKGNMTAGIRARKGMRMLKKSANDFIRASVEHARLIRENKH